MIPYALSDVAPQVGQGRAFFQGRNLRLDPRYLRRVLQVGAEVALGATLDRVAPLQSRVFACEPGVAAMGQGRVALYLHWSSRGHVSPMVMAQLASWRSEGFDVVFVSNAAPPEADWQRLAEQACFRIRRNNVGRDFGAWRDALAQVGAALPPSAELLLVNDSVLGPIRPLAPVVACLRSGGEGFFGLTDSLGGGPHLQSYALLARGTRATADLAAFLAAYRDRRSKWQVVQKGEIALTRFMAGRGHRCAAVFGRERLLAGLDRDWIAALGPRFASPESSGMIGQNPTHHFWRPLVEQFGYPYLKTDLIRRNPGGLAGVTDWPALVTPEMAAMIRDHIALL